MKNSSVKTPVKISVSPWKLDLPGKLLMICICVLPFFTIALPVTVSDAVRDAYFLGSTSVSDFEQLCREWGVLAIAAACVLWFLYERATMRPKRELPICRCTIAMALFLVGYLLLGLLSSLFSKYTSETWLGIYMLYEGYLALVGYGILFAAAWYWMDREEVLEYVKKCLTGFSIVLGILAVLEKAGLCYYNNFLVQFFSGLGGAVSLGDAVCITFGNADYLGMFCAMLLPLIVAIAVQAKTGKQRVVRSVASLCIAVTLLLTEVSNAILIGFGVTIVFLLLWGWHTGISRKIKAVITAVVIAVIVFGGFGFLWTRTGDTFSQKLWNTCAGVEQEDTFQLLSMELDGNTVSFSNEDTTFTITALDSGLSLESLLFAVNGETVSATPVQEELYGFSQPELAHCQVQFTEDALQVLLGYATPIELTHSSEQWQVVGIGGSVLEDVPLVGENLALRKLYTLFNGRVFVWADTILSSKDCWLIGHGAATTIFSLNQNDLPALLNIYGRYVLYNKPHSWYLQIVQDTGVLSLVMVLGMLVLFFVCGFRKCFGKQHQWNPFHTGLLLAVLAYCLAALFNDSLVYHAPMFWVLLGLGWRQFTTDSEE